MVTDFILISMFFSLYDRDQTKKLLSVLISVPLFLKLAM